MHGRGGGLTNPVHDAGARIVAGRGTEVRVPVHLSHHPHVRQLNEREKLRIFFISTDNRGQQQQQELGTVLRPMPSKRLRMCAYAALYWLEVPCQRFRSQPWRVSPVWHGLQGSRSIRNIIAGLLKKYEGGEARDIPGHVASKSGSWWKQKKIFAPQAFKSFPTAPK